MTINLDPVKYEVFYQRLDIPVVFRDGFESGNTSAWSG